MRSKLPALALLAAVGVVVAAPAASAVPPPVKVSQGGCDEDFTEVASVLDRSLCVYSYDPDIQVITNGDPCPDGTTQIASVFQTIRVCYSS